MSPNIVAIAGVPPVYKPLRCEPMILEDGQVGWATYLDGLGADEPFTEPQASSLRWVAVGLIGVAAIGLIWMENRRHA